MAVSFTPHIGYFVAGYPFSLQLSGTGGGSPFTFSDPDLGCGGPLCCNRLLESGLTISSSGLLSGIPSAATGGCVGCSFKITVTDVDLNTADVCFTLSPLVCPTITLTPASFSSGATGVLYNETISASGGTGPYTYTITYGNLPAGLALDVNTGEISGIPTTEDTTPSIFVITATDANGCTETGEYSVSVAPSEAITDPPYRSANPTLADHTYRLQHFMCCIGNRADELATKLRTSTDCCCEINNLELLIAYWYTLSCYDPTASYNCLTQQEVDAMWDNISTKCDLCFAPWGTRLIDPSATGYRITEDSFRRITEDGFYRVIES